MHTQYDYRVYVCDFFFFFYFSANWQNVVLLHFGIILHTQIVWEKNKSIWKKTFPVLWTKEEKDHPAC